MLLGVDLGTSTVKAALFSAEGKQITSFSQNYPTAHYGSGRSEQNPNDWLRLVETAIRCISSHVSDGAEIWGAITSQVNTHVFVDHAGKPLLPAITWQDTRAVEEARELDQRLTDADKVAWFGAPMVIDSSHILARMYWIARHQPHIWERTAHVLLPKDFAMLQLTGELATDPLSNIGLVGSTGHYVPEILALVPGAAERLAPVRPMTELIGQNDRGIRMTNGTMDGWAGLVGAGACHDNSFIYLSGTSEILGASSHTVTGAPGVVVFNEAENVRLHAGPTQSGGASQEWFCTVAGLTIEDMISMVDTSTRRPVTPLFLPQLAGERAPMWNASLRGAFLGLDAGMQTADLARAVYEGVAFSARAVLDALQASCGSRAEVLSCAGGGFRSAPWGQIRANILGRPLRRLSIRESGVLGAACIASVASGHASSLAAAYAPFEQFDQTWEPDPTYQAFYDDLFALYQDAQNANESIGKRLTSLQAPGEAPTG